MRGAEKCFSQGDGAHWSVWELSDHRKQKQKDPCEARDGSGALQKTLVVKSLSPSAKDAGNARHAV